MPRWVKVVLAAVALLLFGGAAAGVVVWRKLPEIAADRASVAIGRTVAIGKLRVVPGRWVGVEARDVRVANLPGGTRPEMATLGKLTAKVALWPLLGGRVVARSVHVEQGDLLLEKVDGQPNWRNGPKRPPTPGGRRNGFPTLLGATTVDGVITLRTTSGTPLVTKLDGVTLEALAPDQPARLVGPGSYQSVPISLDLKLGSFDQLHDSATPFPADITMTSGDTVVQFVGTMTKPLDADGAAGQLSLSAPSPGVLERVSGADPSPAPPLRIAGEFKRDGDLWRLQQAKGALGDVAIEDGRLELREGSAAPRSPDQVDVDLRLTEVDVDRLLAAFNGGSAGGQNSFLPDAAPDPLVSAKLSAAGLTYAKIRFLQPTLSATLEPRLLTLDGVSFGALGGQVRLDGQVRAAEDGKTGALSATLAATGLEVSQLRQALGAGQLPLSGRVDVRAVTDGSGPTAAAALEAGRASIVATMQGGSVSARVVALASTNVAGLFQSSDEMVPVNCLLAVMEVRGGVATIGPMRLRSARGTIVARGQVNLLRDTLDVVVASEARTTGVLALDVPVRVSGRYDDPTIRPAGAAAGRSALAGGSVGAVAPAVRPYAQRSACAR